jgi:hypothetical protein
MRGFTVQGVSVNRPSKKKVVTALNVLSGLTMGCRVCITALNRIRAESCLVLDLNRKIWMFDTLFLDVEFQKVRACLGRFGLVYLGSASVHNHKSDCEH